MENTVKTQSTIPKLKFKNVIGYGCGDAGGVITIYMVAMYMSRYLQVQLEVNAGILATMLLVWNVWDTVNDPLMGTIMDITFAKAKSGKDKFRPWILASIPLIVFGMIAFYSIPARMGGGIPMLVALFILKIIYEGGYTMMNIGMAPWPPTTPNAPRWLLPAAWVPPSAVWLPVLLSRRFWPAWVKIPRATLLHLSSQPVWAASSFSCTGR